MRNLGRCGRRRLGRKAIKFKDRATSQSHDEDFLKLQRWMKGIVKSKDWMICQSLQPCHFTDTGRGMRALRNFKPGDCVVSIPYNLLITPETVLNSLIGLRLKEYGYVLTPQQALTLFLALESVKGNSSVWIQYISTLPKVYTTPLYFLPGEMNLLTPRAKLMAETLRTRFNVACEEMLSFVKEASLSMHGLISKDILRWAWSTVDTRSVYLETRPHASLDLKTEESNVALAPFLDMLNHNDTAQVTAGLNPVTNCYEITTENRYKKYDQVFISYGPHDNSKLLVNYGFTLSQNLNNCYIFSTDDIKKSFPTADHWDRKLSLLYDCNFHKNLVCTMDGPSWSLMTAMKLVALSWEQLSLWKRLLQGMSISHENDITADKMALTLLQKVLWKAKRHTNFVTSQPPTVHKDLIVSLAMEDVAILEHSLKILGQR